MIKVQIKGTDDVVEFPEGSTMEQMRGDILNQYQVMQPNAQSLQDKTKQKIADFLFDNGIVSDRYGAQRIGDNLSMMLGFHPAVGAMYAGDEAGRALKEGNYLDAAASAGLEMMGAAGDLSPAIFAGIAAKTADLKALDKAKKMFNVGADRDEIWKETGWWNDKGDWKFEISADVSDLAKMRGKKQYKEAQQAMEDSFQQGMNELNETDPLTIDDLNNQVAEYKRELEFAKSDLKENPQNTWNNDYIKDYENKIQSTLKLIRSIQKPKPIPD